MLKSSVGFFVILATESTIFPLLLSPFTRIFVPFPSETYMFHRAKDGLLHPERPSFGG